MPADDLSDQELVEIAARRRTREALAELAKDTVADYGKIPKGVPPTKRPTDTDRHPSDRPE